MHLTAQILTEDEQHRIHNMSLRILEEVGIRFHGDRAARILRENGVKINPEDKIAKIPSELVEQASEDCTKVIRIRCPKPSI